MGLRTCVGGCLHLFFLAVLLDVTGVILLFTGLFANVRIRGRFYGDFFIYSGSLMVFFSLGCWLMWYVGNVQVPEEEEEEEEEEGDGRKKKRSGIAQLARKLSERLSQRLKGEEGARCVEDEEEEEEEGGSRAGSPPPHKASKVTWGRSTAYHNEGYDDSLDSPAVEEKVEEKVEADKEEV